MSRIKVVDALFAAFSAADATRVAELFHENGRQRVYSVGGDLPFGGTIEGREAIAQHYETLWRRWRLVRVTVDDPVVDGDRVAVRTIVDALEEDGQRPFRTEVMHFLTIVDDRILELEVFLENASAGVMRNVLHGQDRPAS